MSYRAWNKGLTKETHSGLAKIAEARRKKNNFTSWQKKHPVHYASLRKNANLAEFYGTMLGDGCIEKFPRTEKLSIAFNAKEKKHIRHIRIIIRKIFQKHPKTRKLKGVSCTQVYLYQKHISARLKFPLGIKKFHKLRIPNWITRNKKFLIYCLKGLFETDGDWVIDKNHGTNVIKFTNVSSALLKSVYKVLFGLGFTAHLGHKRVTISRKLEVERFVKIIKFRQY